jgi:hypothetical protein
MELRGFRDTAMEFGGIWIMHLSVLTGLDGFTGRRYTHWRVSRSPLDGPNRIYSNSSATVPRDAARMYIPRNDPSREAQEQSSCTHRA